MKNKNDTTAYRLTCHVDGCENCDVPIIFDAPAEIEFFVCGPCCKEITDVVPI
jgi:hypothetical protein